jgi:hypothetical protein
VICWVILAALMTRWLSPDSPRRLALWVACLFAHGLLWSVRFSLLDGPSLLLIASAIVAAEHRQQLVTAAIVGVAGLGRETNLLASVALRKPSTRRDWIILELALVLILLPLLVWQDYLRSIYRSTSAVGQDQLDRPLLVFLEVWRDTLALAHRAGVTSPAGNGLAALIALTTQVIFLVLVSRREHASPWWRVAVVFAVLMFLVHRVVGRYPARSPGWFCR